MRIISPQTAQKLSQLANADGVFLGASNGKNEDKMEVQAAHLPFFLQLVSYDEQATDKRSLEEYDSNQSCGSLLQQVEVEQVLACVEKAEIDYNGIYCQNNQNSARLAKHLKKAQAWAERLVISR